LFISCRQCRARFVTWTPSPERFGVPDDEPAVYRRIFVTAVASDLKIAKQTGTSHHTVAKTRADINGVQNWQNANIEHSPIRSNGNALATLVPIPRVIALIWSTKDIAARAEFDQAVGQFVVVKARGGYLASEP
jgi:hypothetical protein